MLRRPTWLLFLGLLVLAATLGSSPAGAAIAPPWCGTPMPDAAANLPATRPGAFPHIPYYAIGCTLESIAARSGGRMTVDVNGQSALGRDKYVVVINELRTEAQQRGYRNWLKIRRDARDNPEKAQRTLERVGGEVKVPLFVQGGIHGNEYEGVDAAMQIIERLATTPYGTDPEVDKILDQAIVIFNPIQNPDGRIAGTRANGNGFDLNRDFLTQSQPETIASVAIMQKWLPPETLDLHGYWEPTLIEATTKPHNPGIDYDLWLKWNQSRIDANEAAMNAEGFLVTRPINDWCADGSMPRAGVCADGTTRFGPRWAESWDDWGPFYTPMYSQLVGLNGSTVEMCNEFAPFPTATSPNTECGPPVTETEKIGASGARRAQYITVWSTLLFDTTNRVDLMHDQLEIYRRGVTDAPRPACCPPPFDIDNNWMHEYPQAYVIPVGAGQRSDAEARRLVEWLLTNGIEVETLQKAETFGSARFDKGSYVVWMDQPHRGLADTALGPGVDVSSRISILYAPPAAWSHGYLWGADVVTIPEGTGFDAKTHSLRRLHRARGDLEDAKRAAGFALLMNSPTAVRTANALLRSGVSAWFATAPFATAAGTMPAGTLIFPAASSNQLEAAADDAGLDFQGLTTLPAALEPVTHSPRIAVLTAAVNQDVWVLRNLGFTADPIATGGTSALNNPTAPNPLDGYDVVFNTAGWPGGTTARSRLTAFFANGGGYIGANLNGANFLVSSGQVTGLAGASNSGGGRGYSGIVIWNNTGSGTSVVTGAYRGSDTAIMDPPTWFTAIPATMTVDGALPLTGFFLSGLWPGAATSPGAPGAAVIAHGTNTAGTARLTSFAMNPLYRADPEREWPMLASAAYWADQ